jgi:HAD superfamily hydrolase (TIGR01549 family)
MVQNDIKAIVWDLDGTLIHFKIDWIRARREAIKILKKYGVPRSILSIRTSILDNVRLSREFFESSGMSQENVENIIKNVDEVVNHIEYEAALDATAVNGIEEVLKYIRNKELAQAIYTFNTYRNAKKSLEKAGILKYFSVIVGRDAVKNAKPHPDHLIAICDKLGLTPSQIIVIGDNHRDIQGAINVGAKSIAIKNSLSKLTDMELLNKADKMIEEHEIPLKLIQTIEELL